MEDELNTQLPYKLNDRLLFEKVKAVSKHKFKYYYTLLADPDISEGAFVKQARPQIINSLKNTPESRSFKEDNIIIIYSYSKKDGSIFAEFEVKPEEY